MMRMLITLILGAMLSPAAALKIPANGNRRAPQPRAAAANARPTLADGLPAVFDDTSNEPASSFRGAVFADAPIVDDPTMTCFLAPEVRADAASKYNRRAKGVVPSAFGLTA